MEIFKLEIHSRHQRNFIITLINERKEKDIKIENRLSFMLKFVHSCKAIKILYISANMFFINGGHQELASAIFKGLDQGLHIDISSMKSCIKKLY